MTIVICITAPLILVGICLFAFNTSIEFLDVSFLQDWSYELPEGFSIMRVNKRTILLESPYHYSNADLEGNTWLTSDAVESYITDFCYGESYIGVRRVDASRDDDELEYEAESVEYWLVYTKNETRYGPFSTESEFDAQCELIGVTDLCEWIATVPRPQGAQVNNRVDCSIKAAHSPTRPKSTPMCTTRRTS